MNEYEAEELKRELLCIEAECSRGYVIGAGTATRRGLDKALDAQRSPEWVAAYYADCAKRRAT